MRGRLSGLELVLAWPRTVALPTTPRWLICCNGTSIGIIAIIVGKTNLFKQKFT